MNIEDFEKLPWPEGCERFKIIDEDRRFAFSRGSWFSVDFICQTCRSGSFMLQDMCNAARCWFLDQVEKFTKEHEHAVRYCETANIEYCWDMMKKSHKAAEAWAKAGRENS